MLFSCSTEGFKEAAEAFAAEANMDLQPDKLSGMDERLTIQTCIVSGKEGEDSITHSLRWLFFVQILSTLLSVLCTHYSL